MTSRGLRNTLRGIEGTLRKLILSDESGERDANIPVLQDLIDRVKAVNEPSIPPRRVDGLGIELHHGVTEEERQLPNHTTPRYGPFFCPSPTEMLTDKHPTNSNHGETTEEIRRLEVGIVDGPPFPTRFGFPIEERTSLIASLLGFLMDEAARVGTKDNSEPLRHVSGWSVRGRTPVYCENYPKLSPAQNNNGVNGFWMRPGSKSPHIKLLMHHGVEGNEDMLIREEVLVILAVMKDRMSKETFKKHVIVPVMLLSIVGKCHGRILIAHFDGFKLVIEMSRLYRLLPDDKASYLLFLRYLAGPEDPQGPTTTFQPKGQRK